MISKFLDLFKLLNEKEDFQVVRNHIDKDVVFKGTNLWVLIFAILVASLGLNINSSAVVIGAMLISPLMGPIMGIGFGVAINDLPLIRKAAFNYAFAMGVGLTASTVYFLLTPINDAHSEILARTLPTIYDVMIAFFGGFAGIIAFSSKQKGNVIAGVAIATALMPPLCTAGYGLATWQLSYFFGAFYLYLINSVFIAAATIITAYVARFPVKKYDDPQIEKREKRIIWIVVIVTLIPSLYLGYSIVEQRKFTNLSNQFIQSEAVFANGYLLNQDINPKSKTITLTFGGREINAKDKSELIEKLKYYKLEEATIIIKQGFAIKEDTRNIELVNQIDKALKKNEEENKRLKLNLDSIEAQKLLSVQVFNELKIQYPSLTSAIIEPVSIKTDSVPFIVPAYLVALEMDHKLESQEMEKLKSWLKVRLNNQRVKVMIESVKP